MHLKKTAAAVLALSAAIGVPAAGAAKPKHPSPAVKPAPVTYVFRGAVFAAPGAGATTVQVQINSGNKAATLKMGNLLANGNPSAVLLNASTNLVSWSADNKPLSNPNLAASIQVGDPVAVTIVGPRNATIAQLLALPATRVDDYVLSTKPHGRLFLFDGSAVGVDTVAHTITLNITKTNWRAGYALKSASASSTETFTYDPAKTMFVTWQHGKAHLVTPAQIVAGDHVTIKIFMVNYDSRLGSLLANPAWRVNLHEPAALVAHDIRTTSGHTL
jgi:hypothetical protein